jgi:hypothetical protein
MNVSDLDVYMDVLYIVCANCASFVIPAVLVILFSTKKNKPRLTYDGTAQPSRRKLADWGGGGAG